MNKGEKKWYESMTIRGSIITAIGLLVTVLKLEIGTEEITEIVTIIFGLVGTIMSIYGRVNATRVIK